MKVFHMSQRTPRILLIVSLGLLGIFTIALAIRETSRSCWGLPDNLELWRLNSRDGWSLVHKRVDSALVDSVADSVFEIACDRGIVLLRTKEEFSAITEGGAKVRLLSEDEFRRLIREHGLRLQKPGEIARGFNILRVMLAMMSGVTMLTVAAVVWTKGKEAIGNTVRNRTKKPGINARPVQK